MRSLALITTLACVAALTTSNASIARASHVQCGDVITKDTQLDSDIVCKGGEYVVALTIGADGVTLDLAGHRVEGRDPIESDTIGISSGGLPRRAVTIERGTITGFSRGIWFAAVTTEPAIVDGVVRDVTVDGLEAIHLNGSGNLVTRSRVSGTNVPLAISGDDNRVIADEIYGEGAVRALMATSDVEIVANRVSLAEPTGSGPGGAFPAGIYVLNHRDAVVRANRVRAHGYGIYVSAGDPQHPTLVEANRVTDSGTGIYADSSLIRRNVTTRNVYGVGVGGLSNAFGNTATGNERSGIVAGTSGRVERNTASGNGEYGIIGFFTAQLVRNVANDNGADGIIAAGEPQGDDGYPEQFVTVTRNTANYNAGYGIRGVRAIDGDGNRARGNGLGECLNVSCR